LISACKSAIERKTPRRMRCHGSSERAGQKASFLSFRFSVNWAYAAAAAGRHSSA